MTSDGRAHPRKRKMYDENVEAREPAYIRPAAGSTGAGRLTRLERRTLGDGWSVCMERRQPALLRTEGRRAIHVPSIHWC